MADYTFGTAGSNRSTSTPMDTSLTPPLPTGTAAGDVLFLFAKGAVNNVDPIWTAPFGWTEVGLRVTGVSGSTQYNALQLWRKTAGSLETAPTVNLSSGSSGRWDTSVIRYVPSSPSSQFDLVTACVDYSAASTFTGQTLSVDRTATTITFIAVVGGTPMSTASNAQGFTRQASPGGTPGAAWFDKDTTAGTVSLPSFPNPGTSYMAKVFAFDRTVPVGEWGVDQVRW